MMTQPLDPHEVRPSAIAGTWYPGDPRELATTVDEFLDNADDAAVPDALIALISPHAGYPYSGQTAAYAYRQVRSWNFDTIVLIGPSHYEDFGAFAISTKRFYRTPLGDVELDQDFISTLGLYIPISRVERDREHSLEIQLPFLQRVLSDFKIVPIMMSRPFYIAGSTVRDECERLAAALARLAPTRRALFVASSDLSHLHDYGAVKEHDARFAELVAQYDVDGLASFMAQGECRACGDAPIIATMLAAQKLKATHASVLHLTNSGDVTGERERAGYVVGYLAAGIFASSIDKAA